MNGIDFLNTVKNKYPSCDPKIRFGIFPDKFPNVLQVNNNNYTLPAYTDENNLAWITVFCGSTVINEVTNDQLKTLDVQVSNNTGTDSTNKNGLFPFGFSLFDLPEWITNLLLYFIIGLILIVILKHIK